MKKLLTAVMMFALLTAASTTAFAAEKAVSSDKKNEAAEAIAEITKAPSSQDTKTAGKTAEKKPETTAVKPAADKPISADKAAASADKVQDTAAVVRPIKPSPMQAGDPETEESTLVTAEWLLKNKNNVILVDARPESLYIGGHIQGAVNASWTYFANMSAPTGSMKYGTIYAPATMGKRIGALGINGKKTVIVYDDAGGWGQSGWTLWILRMSGVKNAKILDGGLTAWKTAGGKTVKTKSSNKAVPFAIKAYKSHYLVNTEWINNNLGKEGLVVLDVRTPAEYEGKIRPFQEKRAGHLPGAVNIEMSNFVTSTYNFKEEAEIAELLKNAGITPDTEIVIYDTAGVRAAFVTMALRYAGFHKSQCYDEGFQAWAGAKHLPIEKAE